MSCCSSGRYRSASYYTALCRANTASDLQHVVKDQRAEIMLLNNASRQPSPSYRRPSRASSFDFEWGYTNQQKEIGELKSMIMSLREDLQVKTLADQQQLYDALLARLSDTQRRLKALQMAHEVALKAQVTCQCPVPSCCMTNSTWNKSQQDCRMLCVLFNCNYAHACSNT